MSNIPTMESKNFELSEKPTALVGSLKKTEYITLGHYQRCEIMKVIITDLITKQKNSFVRLEMTYEGNYGSESVVASLTYNEVDALINSLNAFNDTVITSTPNVYTEVNYTTDDFKAGCYYSNNEWTVFLKLDDRNNNSYIIIPRESIGNLVGLLNNSK